MAELSQQKTEEPTLRDKFAVAALSGLLADINIFKSAKGKTMAQTYADKAYLYADAMLEARKQ